MPSKPVPHPLAAPWLGCLVSLLLILQAGLVATVDILWRMDRGIGVVPYHIWLPSITFAAVGVGALLGVQPIEGVAKSVSRIGSEIRMIRRRD